MLTPRHPTRYTYKESRGPIVRVICPAQVPDLAAVEDHARFLDGLLARGFPYGLIIDARGAGSLDARGRDRIRQQRTANIELRERYQLALAYVSDLPLERAIIRSILATSPGSSPERLCGSIAEAEEWVSACLAAGPRAAGALR